MDEFTEKGLRGEIELLQRLRGVERVIQLIDYEMNREKQSLSVLMELGELDFNSLLKNRQSGAEAPTHNFDITFVRYYWKEMLECVQAIHARAVVHSDLKPANFVLVKGRLKLIDFGIANAIQTDVTTNVYRESMAGTVNYMSPESLMDSTQYAFTVIQNGHPYIPASGAPKVVKVGKPSDVWSLGCILYQMVYGIPPFGKMADPRSRIQAIVNWSHRIEIPTTTEDGSCVPVALLQTMRRCLSRDQTDRPTCETLLSEANNFLYPKEYDAAFSEPRDGQFLPMTEELLGRVIQSNAL
ncbi:LOW QUALITY PROTEIN: serine threonine-protein kinase MPS1 [Colletotrichum tofieldiae]|nr:LOW QUALITY PROTEIN: serine threonine-protein kinase MPS1 [Colletotrichum tofieldiae]